MTECRLVLPYPPSVNHYKRMGRLTKTKSGKWYQPRVNSDKTKQYFIDAWIQTVAQASIRFGSATISLNVTVCNPDKRKRDLDNILKVLIDSLQNAQVFNDDSQIARLLVQRGEIIKHGAVFVVISTMEDTQ